MTKPQVFTFGDKLPKGKDEDIFVSYNVKGFPGGLICGPYHDMISAKAELDDIVRFDDVENVKLVTRLDLNRKEFYPYTGRKNDSVVIEQTS